MKWFGVDYRYVIAGVGAVFILAYEFVGTQSGEIQPDKQEAQNSKALSVEALNEKLASALTANSASLEGVKASVLGQDEKSNINVRLILLHARALLLQTQKRNTSKPSCSD